MLNNLIKYISNKSYILKQPIKYYRNDIVDSRSIIKKLSINNTTDIILTHPFSGKYYNYPFICLDELFKNYFP